MGHSSKHTSRASKRAQFDHGKQSNEKPKFIIGSALAILVVLIGYLAITGGARASAVKRVSAASDGEVRIPVADLSSGQAKFFEYTAANYIHTTRRHLLEMVRKGLILAHPLDPHAKKKDWRFLLSELHAYMVSCETRPPGARKPPRRV